MTAPLRSVERACPTCGAAVLSAPVLGRVLDAQPHPLAVWLPDQGGRRKTVQEALDGVPGHHVHKCRPVDQPSLFAGES